jgi:hypothetical protein
MAKWQAAFLLLAAVAVLPASAFPLSFSVPPSAAPPEACGFTLSTARPCIDFLTNLTIQTPTQNCCDRLASILNNSSTRICLCHMLRSDINHYTQADAPINLERAIHLPATCTIVPPIDTLYMCFGKSWKPGRFNFSFRLWIIP